MKNEIPAITSHPARFDTLRTVLLPSLLICASALLAACGNGDAPGPDRPGEKEIPPVAEEDRQQWYWRDRLSVRPEPLTPPATPGGLAEELAPHFDGVEEVPPPALEDRIAALAAAGEAAVPLLAEQALNGGDRARFLATSALGRIGGPHAQEPLLHRFRDLSSTTAIVAADAVAESGERWTTPRMIKTLGPYAVEYNPYLMVRVKSAVGLIRHGNYAGVPFLIAILKDNTPAAETTRQWDRTTRLAWEKEVALEALSALAGESFGFCVDSSRPAQAAAAMKFDSWWKENRLRLWNEAPPLVDPLLVRHVRSLVAGLASFQIRNKDGAQFVLKNLGPPVFPFLMEGLESDSFYVRFHTLDVIGAVAPLAGERAGAWSEQAEAFLSDRSGPIRSKACSALGQLGQARSVPPIAGLFGDPDGDVRLKAVEAVGRIGGVEGIDALRSLLAGTEKGQLRVEILAALARLSATDVEAFVGELLAESSSRQDWALQKVIALTGNDFSFPLGGPTEARQAAAAEIHAALLALER